MGNAFICMLYLYWGINMKIRNKESGITLVETLIAGAILILATTAIIQFYLSSFSLSEINKEETTAIAHLTNMLEAIKCTPFSNIAADFPDGVADNNYTAIVGNYTLTGEHIVVSYVNPASDPLEINASVNWQDKKGANRIKCLITKRTGYE